MREEGAAYRPVTTGYVQDFCILKAVPYNGHRYVKSDGRLDDR
jgi:hypothetical protein